MAQNMTAQDKVKEITERLEKGVQELFDSEKYRNYLHVMSQFYRYSPNNCLLIAMQRPEATQVAGYRAWQQKFDRRVNRGEKAISILAPCPYKVEREVTKKDEDGREHQEKELVEGMRYRVTYVFDVSQTNGKPLPKLVYKLDGTMEDYDRMQQAIMAASPALICFGEIPGEANGLYSPTENVILIQRGMSEQQTIKTMIHEVAHATLHSGDNLKKYDQNTREVQAESVAFVSCSRFGLDTSDYSFGYIASWSTGKELTELKESLQVIRDASADIIDNISTELKKLSPEIEMAQEIEELVKTAAAKLSI